MIRKPKYLRNYENLFLELSPFIESIRSVEFNGEKTYFKGIVIAAFTKCYDYNLYNSQSKEYDSSFYKLPMLRGICEDLITLSYFLLEQLIEKQTEYTGYLQFRNLHRSLEAQSTFFTEKNPGQIVVSPDMFSKEEIKEINEINDAHSNFKFPNIRKMAEAADLKSIYDFLYHATSAMVHFNPDILMKLGWGEIDSKGSIKTTKFSVKNYYEYYLCLVSFKGTVL